MNDKLVSIIIPYYDSPSNNTQKLDAMLASIKEFDPGYDCEVIIQKGKKSRLGNINDGIKQARGRYLLVCDDDLLFIHNNWLKDLMNIFETTLDTGLVSALMLRKDKETIEHGGAITLPDAGGLRKFVVPNFLEKLNDKHIGIRRVEQIAGCFMLFDRTIVGYLPIRVYPEVGGWEACDFQAQIRGTGHEIYINMDVHVIHDMITDDAERDKKYDGQQMRKHANMQRYMKRWSLY
jgi:glycosyltransferase involved in cell wall biosynthesis